MLCRKWEAGSKNHLENRPGLLLSCLLTKSLFPIKPVIHFPKTLTSCGFCKAFVSRLGEQEGYGCCESRRVACLSCGIRTSAPGFQRCLCMEKGILLVSGDMW